MGDPEHDLVARVRRLAGPLLAQLAPRTSVPISWWGALTCNESGRWLVHDLRVPARYEESAFLNLMRVVRGQTKAWRQIGRPQLDGLGEIDLRRLASSWGLTQVMGYHTIRWGATIDQLNDPAAHYGLAARLLAEFCERFDLDPRQDFEPMARCWNTGRADDPPGPAGDTHDPLYCPNLLRRQEIWSQLEKNR